MKIFTHSGASGDMVYGLAAMKRMGGGQFLIHDQRNESSSPENMIPLINSQKYVFGSLFDKPEQVDLDKFRDTPADTNLVLRHFRAFGLYETNWSEPWLTVPEPFAIPHIKYSIINCTERYNGYDYDWKKLIDSEHWWDNRFCFVGTAEEHAEFCKRFGSVRHLPTKNALELAQIVKYAETVYCNESLVLALARGLGHKRINLACADGYDHQLFRTPNETYLNR